MKVFSILATLLGVAMAAPTDTIPSQKDNFTRVRAGTVHDIVLREENTLNATSPSNAAARLNIIPANLPLKLVNNFAGGALNAYISGLDSSGRIVFLSADGNLIYPSSGGSTTPVKVTDNIAIRLPAQGQTLSITLPIAMSSGRVYFAEGELAFYTVSIGGGRDGLVQPSIANLLDPSVEINWGFVELTLTNEGVIWANISFVDFVGLTFGMEARSRDGSIQSVLGLPSGSVQAICAKMIKQSNIDGRPWGAHCIAVGNSNVPIRVVSTNVYHEFDPQGFQDYWNNYVDAVWDFYRDNTLQINTQNENGIVDCRVNGNLLECKGDNRGYAKPSTVDILGCNSGPFSIREGDNAIHTAVVPRLCSGFVRTTYLLQGGNLQPGLKNSFYYTKDPTHHYSRIVHEEEIDGKGYAFPYDDVNPDGPDNASGLIADANPESLTFFVGGVRR